MAHGEGASRNVKGPSFLMGRRFEAITSDISSCAMAVSPRPPKSPETEKRAENDYEYPTTSISGLTRDSERHDEHDCAQE